MSRSFLLAAAITGLLLSSLAHAESNEQKLARTQADLQQTRAKADALALKVKVSQHEMDSVRERSRQLAQAVQRNEASLTTNEKQRDALSREVAEREAALTERNAQAGDTLLAMLKIERMPPMALLAQSKNANDTVHSAAILQAAREKLAADAAQLRSELAGLKRARQKLGVAQSAAENEADSLRARRALLDKDMAERSAMDRQLRRDQSEAEGRAETLSRTSSSLQDLVNKVNDSGTSGGRFASRGSLNAPVAGNVLHKFGETKSDNDTYRGIVFASRSQAVVVAPASGEVAFTGPFMNYGPMVLMRHADGYISLLAGLDAINVRVGQKLSAGEPVGRMGNASAPTLYVELREKGKPIDPAGWFANVGKSLAAR